jgi:hypothetical protein
MFCKLSNSEISEGKINPPSSHKLTKSLRTKQNPLENHYKITLQQIDLSLVGVKPQHKPTKAITKPMKPQLYSKGVFTETKVYND